MLRIKTATKVHIFLKKDVRIFDDMNVEEISLGVSDRFLEHIQNILNANDQAMQGLDLHDLIETYKLVDYLNIDKLILPLAETIANYIKTHSECMIHVMKSLGSI